MMSSERLKHQMSQDVLSHDMIFLSQYPMTLKHVDAIIQNFSLTTFEALRNATSFCFFAYAGCASASKSNVVACFCCRVNSTLFKQFRQHKGLPKSHFCFCFRNIYVIPHSKILERAA